MGVSGIPLARFFSKQFQLTELERPSTNANSIANSFWMIAEVLRDARLLSRIRRTIDSYRNDANLGTIGFDYVKLCNDPLLQSLYAETLRLHVASYLMRGPARADMNLKGWRIPRDAVMLISSYNAQTDPKAWATHDNNDPSQSVQRFWAERFLEYPKSTINSNSAISSAKSDQSTAMGSHDPPPTSSKLSTKKDSVSQPTPPQFSLKGRSGDWIPYGGGQRMCPGRHFAKQEMISSLAIMLTLFDIELVDEAGRIPENDMAGFGFGALSPKGETPVRMRLRRMGHV